MAHIRKRILPSGKIRYEARASTSAGGSRNETARMFERESDAKRWLQDQGSLIERRGISGGQASVAAFAERWLTFLEERSRSEGNSKKLQRKTLVEYGFHINRALRFIGALRLDRLTARDLDDCYSKLLARGGKMGRPLSARTVLHTHRVLHTAFARAVRWRMIPDNPAAHAEPPSPGKSPAKAPTPDELQRYLDAARPTPFWPAILTTISSGLRRSELLAVRWADIDLDDRILVVAQTMWEAKGEYGIRPHKAKTERSLRSMAIPEILCEELRRLKLRQSEERLAYGKVYRGDLDLVFTRPGGEPWQPSEFGRHIAKIARGTSLPRNVAPLHGLRHAHATAMLGAGISIKVTSVRLGHSTTVITQDLYSHVTETLDRTAAEAIDAALRPLVKR